MKATQEQYEEAIKRYDAGGPSAVFRYAAEIGVDSQSYCAPCEGDTPDCDDDCCLVCGDYKPNGLRHANIEADQLPPPPPYIDL